MSNAAAQFEAMNVHDKETLQQMIDYAQSGQCRWRAIFAYYDDSPSMQRCGVCDNCMNPPQILQVERSITAEAGLLDAEVSGGSTGPASWSPGDVVSVRRFGSGEVALASGEQVAIVFPVGRTGASSRAM